MVTVKNNSAVFKEGYHKLLHLLQQRWQEQPEQHDINEFVEQGMQAYRYVSDISEQQLNEIEQQLRDDLTAFVEGKASDPSSGNQSLERLAMQETLWQWLWKISDNSQVEWQGVADDLQHAGIYQSGELVGLGRLECNKCQHQVFHYHPDILSTCTDCNNDTFIRQPL